MKGNNPMRSFWTFIGNDIYDVGCTGQTVYLYDKQGAELAKFKDLTYAYSAVISPTGELFAVKSTAGRLAVYSFEPPALITKFRFSKVDGGQDDNFCFSADGGELYSVEHHVNCLQTALSIYDTRDFSLKRRILDADKSMVLTGVENEKETNAFYLSGFFRDELGVAEKFFVGVLSGSELDDVVYVPEKEHTFFHSYLGLRASGFTQKRYRWSYIDIPLDELKATDLHLSDLWKRYKK